MLFKYINGQIVKVAEKEFKFGLDGDFYNITNGIASSKTQEEIESIREIREIELVKLSKIANIEKETQNALQGTVEISGVNYKICKQTAIFNIAELLSLKLSEGKESATLTDANGSIHSMSLDECINICSQILKKNKTILSSEKDALNAVYAAKTASEIEQVKIKAESIMIESEK